MIPLKIITAPLLPGKLPNTIMKCYNTISNSYIHNMHVRRRHISVVWYVFVVYNYNHYLYGHNIINSVIHNYVWGDQREQDTY